MYALRTSKDDQGIEIKTQNNATNEKEVKLNP